MGDIFTTIAAALVDLNTAKLDVIGEDNKIPTEYIDGLDDLEIDHKHLINYDLTGVSSFNTTTEVNHGDSYSATLTAAELVLVTVGGVDCTEDYYNPTTRTITIDYVTGNVNIFATNESLVTLHYINKYITGSVYISNRDTLVVDGEAYTTTMTVNDGYQLDDIQILMGSEDITGTAWDSVNHTITISSVTDNVFITINTSLMGYYITYSLTGATSSTSVSKVMHGSSFSGTISPIRGYALDSCYYTMGNGSLQEVTITDGNAVISIEEVTGDLVITAAASILEYPITYDLHNANIEYRYASIPHGGDKTLVYTVEAGYDSRRPNVLVTGADFTVVTESRQILISNATGPVTVTVDPSDVYYIISTTTSNCTISTDFEGNTIRPNENYACTITASNGYIIDNLQVRVGDDIFRANTEEGSNPSVQIENTYKTTGTVIINAPYGDITITASAITSTVDVVNFLTNVTTSNAATSVLRNSAYHAELTYDTNTYKDMVVLVEMGGVNITAQVVENGVIDIPAVTGDLKIAAYVVPYTFYNFMYNLNNVSLDYTPFQIREDKPYDSMYYTYVVDPYITISVTMGETDITTECVNESEYRITIPEITDNVVISIVARPSKNPLTYSDVENMPANSSKTVLIANPEVSGFFLGYDSTSESVEVYGDSIPFESAKHMNAIANNLAINPNYRFTLTKHLDMYGDATIDVTNYFSVTGTFNGNAILANPTIVTQEGTEEDEEETQYAVYTADTTTNSWSLKNGSVIITFEGSVPQTIGVIAYKTVLDNTVSITSSTGDPIQVYTVSTIPSISNIDYSLVSEVTMRSNKVIINNLVQASFSRGSSKIYIIVPNGITETIPNPSRYPIGEPYYTILASTSENKYLQPSSLREPSASSGITGISAIFSTLNKKATYQFNKVTAVRTNLTLVENSNRNNFFVFYSNIGNRAEDSIIIPTLPRLYKTNDDSKIKFTCSAEMSLGGLIDGQTTSTIVYPTDELWQMYEV